MRKQTKPAFPKTIKSKKTLLFTKCNKLWSEIVKLKAGMRSEISGKTTGLQSHHVNGKSSYALRFDTRNGICLSIDEHLYGIHSGDRMKVKLYEKQIEEALIKREGIDIMDTLELLSNVKKADLFLISLDLEQQLKGLK